VKAEFFLLRSTHLDAFLDHPCFDIVIILEIPISSSPFKKRDATPLEPSFLLFFIPSQYCPVKVLKKFK
jgi:hypothetical protein